MLTCIALTIFVNFPPHMPTDQVRHEWHQHTFCEPRGISDVPATTIDKSACEVAANEYIFSLQLAGVLPGAKELIQYKAVCTNVI